MKPFLYVKMPQPGDEFGGCYFMSGELTPDDDSWKPLYEYPPCAHCAPVEPPNSTDEIPGPAPESMAEGE